LEIPRFFILDQQPGWHDSTITSTTYMESVHDDTTIVYVSNARGMTVVASHTEVYSVTGTTSFYKFSWCSFYYFNILV